MGAEDNYAGKKVRCSKCKEVLVVPAAAQQVQPPQPQADIIKFRCPGCNQKIGLKSSYAGKTVRCAKCQQAIKVPSPKPKQPPPSQQMQPAISAELGDDLFKTDLGAGDNLLGEALSSVEKKVPAADDGGLKLVPQERPPAQATNQIRCPRCNEMNPAGSRVCGICAFELMGGGGSKGASGRLEGTINKKRALIVVGACIVVWTIIGIYILTILPDFGKLKGEEGPHHEQAKLVADECIESLQADDIAAAKELFEPQLKKDTSDEKLEEFTKIIGKNTEANTELNYTYYDPNREDNWYAFYYNITDDENYVSAIVTLHQVGEDFKVDGIVANKLFEKPIEIGPKTQRQLNEISFNQTIDSGIFQALGKSCCALAVVGFLMMIFFEISMWMIFAKAGYPGWAAIVPFYNMWVLAQIGELPGWVGLVYIFSGGVPYVGPLLSLGVLIYMSVNISKAFNRGVLFGLGMAFIPFIFYPLLAFAVE